MVLLIASVTDAGAGDADHAAFFGFMGLASALVFASKIHR